jgi:hypothetical protein
MTVQLLVISHFFQMVPNIPIVPNAVDKEKYADAETEWAAAFQQKMEQLSGSVSIPGTSVSSPLQVRATQLLLTRCEFEYTALLVYSYIRLLVPTISPVMAVSAPRFVPMLHPTTARLHHRPSAETLTSMFRSLSRPCYLYRWHMVCRTTVRVLYSFITHNLI